MPKNSQQRKQEQAKKQSSPKNSRKAAPAPEPEIEEELPIADIDTRNFDYQRTDLNKLPEAEIRAHKKAMDSGYQKNFVGKDNPSF